MTIAKPDVFKYKEFIRCSSYPKVYQLSVFVLLTYYEKGASRPCKMGVELVFIDYLSTCASSRLTIVLVHQPSFLSRHCGRAQMPLLSRVPRLRWQPEAAGAGSSRRNPQRGWPGRVRSPARFSGSCWSVFVPSLPVSALHLTQSRHLREKT